MGAWLTSARKKISDGPSHANGSLPRRPPSDQAPSHDLPDDDATRRKRCRTSVAAAKRGEMRVTTRSGSNLLVSDDGATVRFLFSLSPKFQAIAAGSSVMQRYGCSFHVYETESVDDSHGVALVQVSPRSNLAIARQARLANSVKKSLIVVFPTTDPQQLKAIKLSYRSEI